MDNVCNPSFKIREDQTLFLMYGNVNMKHFLM
jgi:hypothetical protein